MAMEVGFPGKEYVATVVSVPVLESRLNDSSAAPDPGWFPTNRYLPPESVAITLGFAPVPNGEFVNRVSVPSEPIEYAARLVEA